MGLRSATQDAPKTSASGFSSAFEQMLLAFLRNAPSRKAAACWTHLASVTTSPTHGTSPSYQPPVAILCGHAHETARRVARRVRSANTRLTSAVPHDKEHNRAPTKHESASAIRAGISGWQTRSRSCGEPAERKTHSRGVSCYLAGPAVSVLLAVPWPLPRRFFSRSMCQTARYHTSTRRHFQRVRPRFLCTCWQVRTKHAWTAVQSH